MKERIIFGFDPFVIPFTLGIFFILLYLAVGLIKMAISIGFENRKKAIKHLFSKKIFSTIIDIVKDVLLHVKIFKKNFLLGYMHASIAFGWFMLILIGHIEVFLYTPQRSGVLYYPVFFRYFILKTEESLKGAFFMFLMDLFLLIVLSGVALAIYKRFNSKRVGMKKTTRHKLGDQIALYALWLIFPLRLFAESFTANISGGSFLTKSINYLLKEIPFYHTLMEASWWGYSIALSLFFFALPFSRYMHIPTEAVLIFLRNAGVKLNSSREGYAEAQIFSCSSCGICIDSCPLSNIPEKENSAPVYFIRSLRRRKTETTKIARECLQCGRCILECPIGIDSPQLRVLTKDSISLDTKCKDLYRQAYFTSVTKEKESNKVLYYAGCMTHLTPSIYTSLLSILESANVEYEFMDRDGTLCCGRPLMLSNNQKIASELIAQNKKQIIESGAKTLLLSCPICYRVFKEEYNLEGIEVVHHSQYLLRLAEEGKLRLKKGDQNLVYHDPCDLGRGCKVYEEPRSLLSKLALLIPSREEKEKSHCCGGSLGSDLFTTDQRLKVAHNALEALSADKADCVVTSCPLCLKSLSAAHNKRVVDIAQIVQEHTISEYN